MNDRDGDRETARVAADAGKGARRSGLRPIGEAASRIAAPIVARRGGGVLARLKAEWSAVAGVDLAAQTWPEKLGRDGALKLRVAPGFALDLQHRAPLVIDRINIFFGRVAVTRLVLAQGPVPVPVAGSAPAGPVSFPRAPATGDDGGAFDSRLAGIDDPELRAALSGLGRLVLCASRQIG
ncbi:MAG: DUF721 domain-containing protein [Alphaproteobacteria bacterium]